LNWFVWANGTMILRYVTCLMYCCVKTPVHATRCEKLTDVAGCKPHDIDWRSLPTVN
jgi:hypothetical protein